MSLPPPAAKPTINRIGLLGKLAAGSVCAPSGSIAVASKAANASAAFASRRERHDVDCLRDLSEACLPSDQELRAALDDREFPVDHGRPDQQSVEDRARACRLGQGASREGELR